MSIALYVIPVLPICLVWIVGIILAAVTWRKHPARSLVTIIAFGILILVNIVARVLQIEAYLIVHNDFQSLSAFLNTVSIIETVIDIGVWILILLAIFGWRQPGEQGSVKQAPPTWAPQPPYYQQAQRQEQAPEERVAGSEYIPPQD